MSNFNEMSLGSKESAKTDTEGNLEGPIFFKPPQPQQLRIKLLAFVQRGDWRTVDLTPVPVSFIAAERTEDCSIARNRLRNTGAAKLCLPTKQATSPSHPMVGLEI